MRVTPPLKTLGHVVLIGLMFLFLALVFLGYDDVMGQKKNHAPPVAVACTTDTECSEKNGGTMVCAYPSLNF